MGYFRRMGRGFAVWLAFIPVMIVAGFVAEAIHFPWLIWAVPVAYLIVFIRVDRDARLFEAIEREGRKSEETESPTKVQPWIEEMRKRPDEPASE